MKQWIVTDKHEKTAAFAVERALPPLIAGLLLNRGVSDGAGVRRFLEPDESCLHDPFLLPDMRAAVERIRRAVGTREKILVFSDYDVDGVTSAAICSRWLDSQGADFTIMLPDRQVDGYDFNRGALEAALERGVGLILCLDCGSNSTVIREVPAHGIDVIVIDHHETDAGQCEFLLINPKRSGAGYPFRDLTTGALMFKVLSALEGRPVHEYIDLAALSVVCDVAPLIDENRYIVKAGLERMRREPCLGLEVLMKSAGVNRNYVDTFHLGWVLGPRLNAAGRLARADLSLELLLADEAVRAKECVKELERINNERKLTTSRVKDEALAQAQLRAHLDDYVHVIAGDDWHVGVVGIVASSLKEKFNRPAIVISFENEIGKGSGRSIDGFNLNEALTHCSAMLAGFGGHERACGIEIRRDNLQAFRDAINDFARSKIDPAAMVQTMTVDAEVTFNELDPMVFDLLKQFAPFGEGNPEPVFVTRSLRLKNITDTSYGYRLAWLEEAVQGSGGVFPARLWKTSKFIPLLKAADTIDIAYTVSIQNGRGIPQPILNLRDVRLSV